MDKNAKTNQENINSVRTALAEARKMQNTWLQHGLDFVQFYVEDWDGDWLERWGEDDEDNAVIETTSIIEFLKSDENIAAQLRRLLSNKSISEIVIHLDNCINISEKENRVFAVKDLLINNFHPEETGSNDINGINLLKLAQQVVDRLEEIL
jgi:hypothetical protein